MESKQEKIIRVFNEARAQGVIHNQKEFAEALGVNPSTVSSAMNGLDRALTDRLIKRVEQWSKDNIIERPQQDTRPDIRIPAATMDLYTSMAKSIDRLTALVERMQPGASAFAGAAVTAPKNYLIDD